MPLFETETGHRFQTSHYSCLLANIGLYFGSTFVLPMENSENVLGKDWTHNVEKGLFRYRTARQGYNPILHWLQSLFFFWLSLAQLSFLTPWEAFGHLQRWRRRWLYFGFYIQPYSLTLDFWPSYCLCFCHHISLEREGAMLLGLWNF